MNKTLLAMVTLGLLVVAFSTGYLVSDGVHGTYEAALEGRLSSVVTSEEEGLKYFNICLDTLEEASKTEDTCLRRLQKCQNP